ncbi:MAG TPA: CHASE3 domain-containing protein [Paucimonas sp.]|nr:CHASE3 domain-containing protein [Paucimonas sp.]
MHRFAPSQVRAGLARHLRNPEFRNTRLPLFGMLAALIAFTAIAIGSYYSINRLQELGRLVSRTHMVLERLELVYAQLKDAQSSARIFIISGTPKLLREFEFYSSELDNELDALRRLVADSPQQARNFSSLRTLIDTHLAFIHSGISLRRTDRAANAIAHVASEEGIRLMDNVRAGIAIMRDAEESLLQARSAAVERHTQNTKLLIVFGSCGAYLMMSGAYFLLRSETQRRRQADRALHDANEELHRHANQLEATNKELESFSYSISHDLRIPLRAIAGYTGMLEEDYGNRLDDEGRRLLKVIGDNSKRMGDLINDLLAFSRLGRKEIAAVEVDMTSLAAAAAEEVGRAEGRAPTQLIIENMPPAWGDRALLHQVWTNLISNAFKYSADRKPSIVRIEAEAAEQETIYRIRDNGVGFDMRYYDKLFGVFQRLHSAEEFPGTGVGLAIVQRIVVRHGGRVWAQSEAGKGATFHFSLPRRTNNADVGGA